MLSKSKFFLYRLTLSCLTDIYSSELEVYRADVSEAKAKLAGLEEKSAEIESQKQEAINAISQAERVIHIQKESTSAEVFRLKGADDPPYLAVLLLTWLLKMNWRPWRIFISGVALSSPPISSSLSMHHGIRLPFPVYSSNLSRHVSVYPRRKLSN